jgi:hypothetical protein
LRPKFRDLITACQVALGRIVPDKLLVLADEVIE